ncbi:hypothetical protein [Lacibacter cauensis]|uniref:hypothetical protein n=1 Tax=Lacibacter cauensis TaxID=510947 RepID=UPI0011A8B671|nr:hypothetical protein [Lacibacter cauensis]
MQHCLFCGHIVQLVHVHGHYQCPVCGTNALPCCDGDNCHTNQYFNESPANPLINTASVQQLPESES